MEFGPVDYASGIAPSKYRCSTCDAHGVKLWREYQTFANNTTLECAACVLRSQKKKGPVDRDGRIPDELSGDKTDAIGWRIPAVPTEEGDTYWGYSSVPKAGCDWWRKLPTRL